MFNLGDTSIEDIPDGFPVGTSNHEMTVKKVEVLVPQNLKDEPAEIKDFKRNLKVVFEVSDADSDYFETTAMVNIVIYNFPEGFSYGDLKDAEAKAKIRKSLTFYRQRMRQFGFSDDEINGGEITPDMIQGLNLVVTVRKANDDSWPSVQSFKLNESVIED